MVVITPAFPQKSLNNLKNELGSVKGSKAEKEQEVERLTKELMVNIVFPFSFLFILMSSYCLFSHRQCARSFLGWSRRWTSVRGNIPIRQRSWRSPRTRSTSWRSCWTWPRTSGGRASASSPTTRRRSRRRRRLMAANSSEHRNLCPALGTLLAEEKYTRMISIWDYPLPAL